MAGERQMPGLGLYAGWTPGSNGWGDQNDSNWRIVSALLNGAVISRTTALPGSPSDGDIYIVPSAAGSNANEVAIRDNGSWVYLTPMEGWMLHVSDEGDFVKWDGSAWVAAFTGGGGGSGPSLTVDTKTASYTLAAGDFDGETLIAMNVASGNTVTLNSGLGVTLPVHITQIGSGQTTIVAGSGVTLHSAGGALLLRAQYSSASIIPLGSETYLVVGDIAA